MNNSVISPLRQAQNWQPDSWKTKRITQQASYPDTAQLEQSLNKLSVLPPLVTSWEINNLRQQIAEAQRGERFILQGGDCAETFADCTPTIITNRLKVLLQMSLVLLHGLHKPVTRIGRFAGQYAKPRSSDTETQDGVTLPSYRGDLVNSPAFTRAARNPDPERLLQAHNHSALTINFVRALVDGGFADLHHPEYWDLSWVEHSQLADEFRRLAESIGNSLHFVEAISGRAAGSLKRADFYTSHEALHLQYETALTRQVPNAEGFYNLATHFPWIGMRTAEMDMAHVEFFRGIQNPIGIKIGPGMDDQWLQELLQTLNPDKEAGRIVLIHRMGVDHIEEHLPPLIEKVQSLDTPVLWMADPMHGNTETVANGVKTRRFRKIRGEVKKAVKIHQQMGTHLGGVHLELTGENVTECTGGARDLSEADLARAYTTTVDPRLNYEQALELAMQIVSIESSSQDRV